MSSGSMHTPTCRELRQLLGVYVVGAIDPAERSVVDAHLDECPSCREELSYLAGLPALLGRVPLAEVESMVTEDGDAGLDAEPRGELLDSLLGRVAARRKARRRRGILALAATAIVAAGGAAAIAGSVGSPAPVVAMDVAHAASAKTHVSAFVQYSSTGHGTAMQVRIDGVAPGTKCEFWVIGRHGQRWLAGSWTAGYAQKAWYPADSPVGTGDVQGFQLTAAGQVLVTVPAS
jgi:Putative zinc-finger